jgi:hypothetical protein
MACLSVWRCGCALAAWIVILPSSLISTLFLKGAVSPQEMAFTLEGKITQKSSGKLTVSTEQNIIFHVTYDDKTEIKREDGGQASVQDLRVGAQIKVDGELAESGEIKARKIVVEKSQQAAAFWHHYPGPRRWRARCAPLTRRCAKGVRGFV